jgi:biotin carboxyl carrier protein
MMGKKYYVTAQNEQERIVEILQKDGSIQSVDGEMRISRDGKDLYRVTTGNRDIDVVVVNRTEESTRLSVGGRLLDVTVASEGEKLIAKLGIDLSSQRKLKDLKAPMPGMVLKVLVADGQHVSKGDGLLILEAMKMENQIKAPADAVVSSIPIKEGTAVDKGEILIRFD